jgi:hypothetical protein
LKQLINFSGGSFNSLVNNFRRIRAGMYYWVSNVEKPFRGMTTNACRYMTCPALRGVRNSYNSTLSLGRNLPAVSSNYFSALFVLLNADELFRNNLFIAIQGLYPIKFKLYEGRKIIACQTLTIKLLEAEE